MKRRIIGLIMAASLAAWPALSAPDWSALSISAELARVQKLGQEPAGPGNAADVYLPYLKGEAKITQEPWFSGISMGMLNDPKEGDADKLKNAADAASDDLAKIMAASAIKESKIWGVYWKPDVKVTVMEQELPKYMNLYKLSALLMYRGREKEKAGDHKAAIEQYAAAFRIGGHMEREADIIGYSMGTALKREAAKRLGPAYQAAGDEAAAAAWAEYLKAAEQRQEVRKGILNEQTGFPSFDQPAVEKFVRDRDMPFALRLDLLLSKHYCLYDRYMMVRCIAIGEPGWVADLEDEFAKERELNQMFVDQLRAHKARMSWLQWAETIE